MTIKIMRIKLQLPESVDMPVDIVTELTAEQFKKLKKKQFNDLGIDVKVELDYKEMPS